MEHGFERDIDIVSQIPAIPTILEVICKTTGMGVAAVARVTEERWVACEVLDTVGFGLKRRDELRIETTFCNQIRQTRQSVIIDHVAEDEIFRHHPIPAMYGFQSYISLPILLPDGSFFGTLCAIHPSPARVSSDQTIGMFKLFAELIGLHIEARIKLIDAERTLATERVKASEVRVELLDERKTSELREQFIAVLGHDLRNPLASISGGTQMLSRLPQADKARMILGLMTATLQRMNGLIDNLMDFARGRLGGGLTLERTPRPLEATFTQVIDEIRLAYPERRIETAFALAGSFNADHGRLGQLLSNLLGNAITHGAEDRPIRVEAFQDEGSLRLSVVNSGKPIPPEALERLFQPFYRGEGRTKLEGLGLGLFIASEIAQAHGGTLEVASSPEETRFTLTLPATTAEVLDL